MEPNAARTNKGSTEACVFTGNLHGERNHGSYLMRHRKLETRLD